MIPRLVVGICSFWLLLPIPLRAAEGFFDSNGVKIYYTVEGKGEPVLLIHGFSVNTVVQWGMPGITKALAKDYQVITLDNRGHGRSGKPHDPKLYGLEMVADQVRLLDHLKIKRAHVVGYSMGSFIVQKMATLYPERILSMTLGGAGWIETVDRKFLDELACDLEQGKGISLLIQRLTPAGLPKPAEEQLRSTNVVFNLFNDAKASAAAIRAMKELYVPEEALRKIQIPALALIGDLDPLKDGVEALQGRLANFQIVVIEHADHMNAFSQSKFLKGLQQFLAEHNSSSADGKVQAVPGRNRPR